MGATRSFTFGTILDAALWMFATIMAMRFILLRQPERHRQWMTRSFACALIFVEVRVILGLTGWEKYTEAIVWTCVAFAFPIADFVLRWQKSHRGDRYGWFKRSGAC